jgi:hypothetical protein
MSLPSIAVGRMDTSTGREVPLGEFGTVYLTVAGVRVRASVHRFDADAELSIVVDPHWTEDNRVNELDVTEMRQHGSQAAIRVRGKQR